MGSCSHCGDAHPEGTAACPVTGESMAYPGPCGTTLEKYAVERRLGGGGFGSVYLARHTVVGREVALKLLGPRARHDADAVQRLLREARAANAIGNPHIVEVYDGGVLPDGRPFLAMERVDGEELAQVVDREAPMSPERAVGIAAQVLDALGAAHRAGIVHRDVKPSNVMLVGGTHVKVLDFGISKVHVPDDGPLTQTGMMMGTPGYAAPEQYASSRDVDARADLYAVGAMLYEMLSGAMPHEASTYEQMVLRACTEDPRPLRSIAPQVPEALARVVHRALERDPAARWQSAEELSDALRAAVAGRAEAAHAATQAAPTPVGRRIPETVASVPETRAGQTRRDTGSRRGLLVVAAAGVLFGVGALGVAWWMLRGDDERQAPSPIAMAPEQVPLHPPPDASTPRAAVERTLAGQQAEPDAGPPASPAEEAPATESERPPRRQRAAARRPAKARPPPVGTLRFSSMTAPMYQRALDQVRQALAAHYPALGRCHAPQYVRGEEMISSWRLRIDAEGTVVDVTHRPLWFVHARRAEDPSAAMLSCALPILRAIRFGEPSRPDRLDQELRLDFHYSAPAR